MAAVVVLRQTLESLQMAVVLVVVSLCAWPKDDAWDFEAAKQSDFHPAKPQLSRPEFVAVVEVLMLPQLLLLWPKSAVLWMSQKLKKHFPIYECPCLKLQQPRQAAPTRAG